MIDNESLIKTGVIVVCISAFLSLFGCKPQILDGPEMVNKAQWTSFSLSHSGSLAQYNFSFDVVDSDDGAFATGNCIDNDGNHCENESGIPVPPETMDKLRALGLDDLEDIPQTPSKESDESDELIILDASSTELSVVYYKDFKIEKAVTSEISMKVYEILVPLFSENSAE